jgi:CMP-N-acetylneuraminic acid synthetase
MAIITIISARGGSKDTPQKILYHFVVSLVYLNPIFK